MPVAPHDPPASAVRSAIRFAVLSIVVAVGVAAAVGPAAAFASIPPVTSPHDDVTEAAAEEAGWPEDALGALREAVRKPDLDEIEWDPEQDEPTHIRPTDAYRPEHHCDRIPPQDNATAFRHTAEYIQSQREAFRATPDPTDRVQALGRALHALQDCYSHSNYVRREAEARRTFDAFLLNGTGSPPAGLVLVAVVPDADRPGMTDDPYPHDAHAKDRSGMNDASEERVGNGTAFEAARRAATEATRTVLEHELGLLSPDDVDALGDADVEAPDQNPLPAPGLAAAGLALAAAATVAVRRR